MTAKTKFTIGVVAPSRPLSRAAADETAAIARDLYPDAAELRFHPQCFLAHGHFAGDDRTRSDALLAFANDPGIDAVWFARGGYGACRIEERVFEALGPAARAKAYLGYSDTGFLLARLYAMGFPGLAHGPMPADVARNAGAGAIERALRYLVDGAPETLEPSLADHGKAAAFNITILAHLLGTPWAPDLSDHVLFLEEVDEHHYAIDRAFFTITNDPGVRAAAGLALGRCETKVNCSADGAVIDFAMTTEEIAREWCARAGIAWLGRADIGHDAENKIVPFRAGAAFSGVWREG